jgi:hypothetical protein
VPAGVVEHEDDVAPSARTGLPGEGGEQRLEEGLRQAGARYQTVSPLVGWTKATTCSHW